MVRILFPPAKSQERTLPYCERCCGTGPIRGSRWQGATQLSLATLDVLTKLLPPALFSDANLLCLTVCRAVDLSLEHGNSDGSCLCYEKVRSTQIRRLNATP
jgi:hypothetical protein